MHGATPDVLSYAGDVPVGNAAITFGVAVGPPLTSNTTTDALPLPTNSVFPSGLSTLPSGPEMGFTPLARAAQHCAPGNPPNIPLSPNPGNLFAKAAKKVWFLQPIRVRPPLAGSGMPVMMEGIPGRHGLALFPPLVISLRPPIVLTASSVSVFTTTMAKPIRSET